MAIDAALIGRLGGGAEVTTTPIDGSQTGNTWGTVWSDEVPAGERWMIAVAGEIQHSYSYSGARFRLGDLSLTAPQAGPHPIDIGRVVDGPATVTFDIAADIGARTTTFTGHVYTVPLSD